MELNAGWHIQTGAPSQWFYLHLNTIRNASKCVEIFKFHWKNGWKIPIIIFSIGNTPIYMLMVNHTRTQNQ